MQLIIYVIDVKLDCGIMEEVLADKVRRRKTIGCVTSEGKEPPHHQQTSVTIILFTSKGESKA
jgi:hypothetical protein